MFGLYSSTFMGNDGIYSVSTESVYQIGQSGKIECFADISGRPYLRDTREIQLSPSVLTLRIPVMCRAHASFRGMLSRELPVKNSFVFNCLSLHTLSFSITQLLQLNPTINTRYKRLNKITIKFGTELKPTKHMVVSYNFTENIDKLNK